MDQVPARRWTGLGSFLSLQRNVLVISATGLVASLGAQAFQPFVPLYLRTLNVTVPQIGMIYVGITIATNLSIFGGILADRVGRKATIVVGGLVGFSLFLGLLGVTSWVAAFVILFVGYFVATLVQPAVTSTIAESVESKDRGSAFGSFWVLSYLGLAIGSLVGGFLPNPGRFEFNIAVIGIAGIGVALLRLLFLKETLPAKDRVERLSHRLFSGRLSRNVWLVMGAMLLFNFSSGLGVAVYPLFSTQQLQLSQGEFAVMIGMGSLVSMVGAFGAGRVSKKLGVKRMMMLTIVLSAILLIPWIYAPNPILAIAFFAVSGFFVQFFLVGSQALMADITSAKERGSIIGLITTVSGLSTIAAPYIGSELWVLINPRIPFLISVLLSGLVVIPLAVVSETSSAA